MFFATEGHDDFYSRLFTGNRPDDNIVKVGWVDSTLELGCHFLKPLVDLGWRVGLIVQLHLVDQSGAARKVDPHPEGQTGGAGLIVSKRHRNYEERQNHGNKAGKHTTRANTHANNTAQAFKESVQESTLRAGLTRATNGPELF